MLAIIHTYVWKYGLSAKGKHHRTNIIYRQHTVISDRSLMSNGTCLITLAPLKSCCNELYGSRGSWRADLWFWADLWPSSAKICDTVPFMIKCAQICGFKKVIVSHRKCRRAPIHEHRSHSVFLLYIMIGRTIKRWWCSYGKIIAATRINHLLKANMMYRQVSNIRGTWVGN